MALISSVIPPYFLDHTEQFGFSFGSLYFPLAPTVMPLLIEALGARGKPALMTVGNAPAEQSEALNKAIEVKGKGLIKVVKWVDQRGALAHEVGHSVRDICGFLDRNNRLSDGCSVMQVKAGYKRRSGPASRWVSTPSRS